MEIKARIKKWFYSAGYEISRVESKSEFGQDFISDTKYLSGEKGVKTIFDVGANKGQTAFRFSNNFPNSIIHSFEPFPKVFETLVANTREYTNIKAHNIAIGKEDGSATLYLNRASETNSLLQNSVLESECSGDTVPEPIGTATIEVQRLDTFCDQNEIEKIDLLKLDCQGYELQVLQGAGQYLSPQYISMVYVEVLFVPVYIGQATFMEIYQILIEAGFKFVGFYDIRRSSGGFLKWCDALFMAP